jgi:hypothetical protein
MNRPEGKRIAWRGATGIRCDDALEEIKKEKFPGPSILPAGRRRDGE